MTPLHDRQRLGVGQCARHEWRGNHRRSTGGGKGEARFLQEPASRDTRNSAVLILGSSSLSSLGFYGSVLLLRCYGVFISRLSGTPLGTGVILIRATVSQS